MASAVTYLLLLGLAWIYLKKRATACLTTLLLLRCHKERVRGLVCLSLVQMAEIAPKGTGLKCGFFVLMEENPNLKAFLLYNKVFRNSALICS